MKTSEKLCLNLPESTDFVDITKISENFKKLDEHVDVVNLLRLGSYEESDTNPAYAWDKEAGTQDNISYVHKESGEITINGTSTDAWFAILFETTLFPGTYTFTGCTESGSDETFYIEIDAVIDEKYSEIARDYGQGCTFTLTSKTYCVIRFRYKKGIVFNKCVIKPMLVRGSSKLDYVHQSKYIDAKNGITLDKILERFAELYLAKKFVKKIEVDCNGCENMRVYQIGKIVICSFVAASSYGYSYISNMPSPTENVPILGISADGKVYTTILAKGGFDFTISGMNDSKVYVSFVYETSE